MSWDRSRAIPWSKLNQAPGVDSDAHKEEIFREMAQERMLQEHSEQQAVEGADDTQDNAGVPQGIPFSAMEMGKQAAFGGCIGLYYLLMSCGLSSTYSRAEVLLYLHLIRISSPLLLCRNNYW